MSEWLDQFGATVGMGPDVLGKFFLSVVVIALIILIRAISLRVVERRVEEPRTRYQWAKSTAYVGFAFAVVLTGVIWLEWVQTLGTFLGLLSAGLAIALRDLVASLAGWMFIVVRRPFEVGDRVQVGQNSGDVVDIRIFQFTILEIGNWVDADQSTGRLIHLPNSMVFLEPLANYTSEFEYLWHEIPVMVTFDSDWRKAKDILQGVVSEKAGGMSQAAQKSMLKASRHILIFYRTFTPTVYTAARRDGILLTIRYLCLPRARRGTEQAIWESILDAFQEEPAIEFAYPTQRIFHHPIEGKQDLRAPLPDWPRPSE